MKGLAVSKATLTAGGGDFVLPHLTLGVFLNNQRTHRIALGTDRRSHVPLAKHQGWLLPAGSTGTCEYDETLEVLTVSIDDALLTQVGLEDSRAIAPSIGSIDPLALQMALNAEGLADAETLYRDSMSVALAAHISKIAKPQAPVTQSIEDRRLRRVVEFIHDNLADTLSLESFASLAAMSPFHFARSFKAATGASPLQYVIAARIDRAKVLLATTKLPVAEIAFRTGYDDPGRFSRHFRKRVGTTPGAFRQT